MKQFSRGAALARITIWHLLAAQVLQWACGAQAAGAETLDLAAPINAYYTLVYAVSVAQAEAAIAQFTDDAVVISGKNCTVDAPCVGKLAIKENYIDDLIARKANAPSTDQRYDGIRLTTQGEITYGQSCGGKSVRLIGGHIFEFHDGLIASLTYLHDKSDAQTARFMACKNVK